MILSFLCITVFVSCGGENTTSDTTTPDVTTSDVTTSDAIIDSSPVDFFQIAKNKNGVICFPVIAGEPKAKYTYQNVYGEQVEITLDTQTVSVSHLLFVLLNGKSTIPDEETPTFTHAVTLTCGFWDGSGLNEIENTYDIKWASSGSTVAIYKNNSIIGTIAVREEEMTAFISELTDSIAPPTAETPYYHLIAIESEAYLVMKNMDDIYLPEENIDGWCILQPLPILTFASLADMREKFLTGSFTEEELQNLKRQVKLFQGKYGEATLNIPNLNTLTELSGEQNAITKVEMYGETYTVIFEKDSVKNGELN